MVAARMGQNGPGVLDSNVIKDFRVRVGAISWGQSGKCTGLAPCVSPEGGAQSLALSSSGPGMDVDVFDLSRDPQLVAIGSLPVGTYNQVGVNLDNPYLQRYESQEASPLTIQGAGTNELVSCTPITIADGSINLVVLVLGEDSIKITGEGAYSTLFHVSAEMVERESTVTVIGVVATVEPEANTFSVAWPGGNISIGYHRTSTIGLHVSPCGSPLYPWGALVVGRTVTVMASLESDGFCRTSEIYVDDR